MSKSVYLSPSTQENNKGEGNYGSEEYRMNQIANVTEDILKNHGLTVYRNKPYMTLTQIVSDSNSKNPDIHFAIHSNAYNKSVRGCEIYCYKFESKGETLAKKIYANIAPLTPTSDRGVKQGYNFYGTGKHMYELAYTKAPASLVEVAFHDNKEDAKWIINNIKSLGIAISKGILDYFGIDYKDSNDSVFYRVMAGSFSNKSNAEKQVKLLKNAGFNSVIMEYKK